MRVHREIRPSFHAAGSADAASECSWPAPPAPGRALTAADRIPLHPDCSDPVRALRAPLCSLEPVPLNRRSFFVSGVAAARPLGAAPPRIRIGPPPAQKEKGEQSGRKEFSRTDGRIVCRSPSMVVPLAVEPSLGSRQNRQGSR